MNQSSSLRMTAAADLCSRLTGWYEAFGKVTWWRFLTTASLMLTHPAMSESTCHGKPFLTRRQLRKRMNTGLCLRNCKDQSPPLCALPTGCCTANMRPIKKFGLSARYQVAEALLRRHGMGEDRHTVHNILGSGSSPARH